MPELPEVETIRALLAGKVRGQTIAAVAARAGDRVFRDTVPAAKLKRALTGRRIEGLGRRGKYLLFALDSGDFLVIHLGMTGALYLLKPAEAGPRHTHLRLALDRADLVFVDPRTFGRVMIAPAGRLDELPGLRRLGPEPLDDSFTSLVLAAGLKGRKAPLKSLLLSQKPVAGLGNIYADEACFRARVNPLRPAGALRPPEVVALHRAIREVLRESISCKGTTIRDYRWDQGRSGEFACRLQVYGHTDGKCPRCGKKIQRATLAGRSTHFCAGCQK
jgi:formamidopyrimidine-DNA glycosylase